MTRPTLNVPVTVTARCAHAEGPEGRGQCPNAATRKAQTFGPQELHLVFGVCDEHGGIDSPVLRGGDFLRFEIEREPGKSIV